MAKTKPREIHFSELSTFHGCAYKHHLRYKERLQPVVMAEPMTVGTLVHNLLDYKVKNPGLLRDPEDWMDAANAEVTAKLEQGFSFELDLDDFADDEAQAIKQAQAEKALSVAHHAAEIAQRVHAFCEERYETVLIDGVPASEFRLRMPLQRGKGKAKVDYVGTLDRLVRDLDDGQVYLLDFKVRKKPLKEPGDLLHSQTGLYQYALFRIHGIATKGSKIIQARNELVKPVKLNKDDSPSIAKHSTTLALYDEALTNAGIPLDDIKYAAMRQWLSERKMVEEHTVWRPGDGVEVSNTFREVLEKGLENIETRMRSKAAPSRIITPMCRTCEFYPLCEAELAGYDAEHLRDTMYVKKED